MAKKADPQMENAYRLNMAQPMLVSCMSGNPLVRYRDASFQEGRLRRCQG